MSQIITPKLLASEPFEVAMGGYQVIVYHLINTQTGTRLAPHLQFENFLEISPKKDFCLLVAWNNVRDPSDCSLRILDNTTGHMHNLGPIHSNPENIDWQNDQTVKFKARIRPSISKIKTESEYDLAKPTLVAVVREGNNFKIVYEKFA